MSENTRNLKNVYLDSVQQNVSGVRYLKQTDVSDRNFISILRILVTVTESVHIWKSGLLKQQSARRDFLLIKNM